MYLYFFHVFGAIYQNCLFLEVLVLVEVLPALFKSLFLPPSEFQLFWTLPRNRFGHLQMQLHGTTLFLSLYYIVYISTT